MYSFDQQRFILAQGLGFGQPSRSTVSVSEAPTVFAWLRLDIVEIAMNSCISKDSGSPIFVLGPVAGCAREGTSGFTHGATPTPLMAHSGRLIVAIAAGFLIYQSGLRSRPCLNMSPSADHPRLNQAVLL